MDLFGILSFCCQCSWTVWFSRVSLILSLSWWIRCLELYFAMSDTGFHLGTRNTPNLLTHKYFSFWQSCHQCCLHWPSDGYRYLYSEQIPYWFVLVIMLIFIEILYHLPISLNFLVLSLGKYNFHGWKFHK